MLRRTAVSDWQKKLEAVKWQRSCRLTTRGRRTGRPHTVTIWFAADGGQVYLATLRLERDWPKNVLVNPEVTVAIGDVRLCGQVRMVTQEKTRAQIESLIAKKYWGARISRWLGFKPQGVFELQVSGEAF